MDLNTIALLIKIVNPINALHKIEVKLCLWEFFADGLAKILPETLQIQFPTNTYSRRTQY